MARRKKKASAARGVAGRPVIRRPDAVLEPVYEADPGRRPVVPHRTVDTVGIMLRAGTISQEMHDAVRDIQAQFTLARYDALLWSRLNGLPRWLDDVLAAAEQPWAALYRLVVAHVGVTIGRYRGRMEQWDVVNKPLAFPGRELDPDNLFLKTGGETALVDVDPIETVKANRPLYVVAVLTVLRAYHVAGRPQKVSVIGSFATWSKRVRAALVWLGEADPWATTEAIRGGDPKLEALTAVVEQWRSVIGVEPVSVRALRAGPEIRRGGARPRAPQERLGRGARSRRRSRYWAVQFVPLPKTARTLPFGRCLRRGRARICGGQMAPPPPRSATPKPS